MPAQTIVVVEDDPAIKELAADIFMDAGLPVAAFLNADDALAFMYENAADVLAIFTDLQMPGHMDGLILAEMVGRHWPDVTVILTSGRVRPVRELPANVRFLSKPWASDQLLGALPLAAGEAVRLSA